MGVKIIMTDPETGKEFEIKGIPESEGVVFASKDGTQITTKEDPILVRLGTEKYLELISVFKENEIENGFVVFYEGKILQKDMLEENGFNELEIKEISKIIEDLKKSK